MEVGIIVRHTTAAQLDLSAFSRLAQIRTGIAKNYPNPGCLPALWAFVSFGVHVFNLNYKMIGIVEQTENSLAYMPYSLSISRSS